MLMKNFLKAFAAVVTVYILLVNSRFVMESVRNALIMCYSSIIPSLYIFMVISSYISSCGLENILYYPFGIYSRLLKVYDRKYSCYLLLSLIGGFAVGAGFIKKLKEEGYELSALKVLSVSMINNSLSFCLLAIGAGMMKNIYSGLFLFISTVTAGLITCFILSFVFEYNIVIDNYLPSKIKKNFVVSVTESVNSTVNICGFVVLFYTICEVISLYIKSPFYNSIISVFTEVTTGCYSVSSYFNNNGYVFCIALSILPLCSLCQIYSITQEREIIKTLAFSRIIHCPVSLLVYSLLVNMFPNAVSAANTTTVFVRAYGNTMEISATLFLITLSFLSVFENNKLFTKTEN